MTAGSPIHSLSRRASTLRATWSTGAAAVTVSRPARRVDGAGDPLERAGHHAVGADQSDRPVGTVRGKDWRLAVADVGLRFPGHVGPRSWPLARAGHDECPAALHDGSGHDLSVLVGHLQHAEPRRGRVVHGVLGIGSVLEAGDHLVEVGVDVATELAELCVLHRADEQPARGADRDGGHQHRRERDPHPHRMQRVDPATPAAGLRGRGRASHRRPAGSRRCPAPSGANAARTARRSCGAGTRRTPRPRCRRP